MNKRQTTLNKVFKERKNLFRKRKIIFFSWDFDFLNGLLLAHCFATYNTITDIFCFLFANVHYSNVMAGPVLAWAAARWAAECRLSIVTMATKL
jgi:hypothetical protein